MTQLALDVRPEAPQSFEAFVAGANAELVSRLKALATPHDFEAVYIWGPGGSGRSHLLRATAAAAEQLGRPTTLAAGADVADELRLHPGGLLVVDDADRLPAAGQIALFRAFNTARLIGLAMLIAGGAPPARLGLREDLRSRIGSALIYQVKPLTEEEMAETLTRHATSRGMRLERDMVGYLLRHGSRDLPALMATLDALDRISLERQRRITLPLLREVLNQVSGFGLPVSD
jgi:DnaA-homolog protein